MNHRGIEFQVGPRTPFPGIGWRIPQYDHLGRPTGFVESPGAFYREAGEMGDLGAYMRAADACRRYIDKTITCTI